MCAHPTHKTDEGSISHTLLCFGHVNFDIKVVQGRGVYKSRDEDMSDCKEAQRLMQGTCFRCIQANCMEALHNSKHKRPGFQTDARYETARHASPYDMRCQIRQDLSILPGGSVWEGPGVLAQHPHQTPPKVPQADCTVLGGHQQQVSP